jgi:hypothetical protein
MVEVLCALLPAAASGPDDIYGCGGYDESSVILVRFLVK